MSEENTQEVAVETVVAQVEEAQKEVVVDNSPKSMDDLLNAKEPTVEEATPETEQEATEDVVDTERPEWLPEKFKTPEAMAESYKHMESKLGVFQGAPEGDYEVGIPEELSETFKWFEEGEAGLGAFKTLAKDMGVSQDGFNRMMEFYVKSEGERESNIFNNKMNSVYGEYGSKESAVKAFSTLNARTAGALGEEGQALLKSALNGGEDSTLAVVKLVSTLLDKSQGGEFKQPTSTGNSTGMTEVKLRELYSDPRMSKDKEYQAEVLAKYKAFYDKQ